MRKRKILFIILAALAMLMCLLPVFALDDVTVELEEREVFLKPGESETYSYIVPGGESITFDGPYFIDCEGEEPEVFKFSHTSSTYTVTGIEGRYGSGYIILLTEGNAYITRINVHIYKDIESFDPKEDEITSLNSSEYAARINTQPAASRFAPVTITSSDPSVAEPIDERAAPNNLQFKPKKTGETTITVTAGSAKATFKLKVLPKGDYADIVYGKDDKTMFYVEKGDSIPSPFVMSNDYGTCKDDKLTYKVLYDIDGEGDHGIVKVDKDGTIHGLREGFADVTAYTVMNFGTTLNINVYTRPVSFSFPEKVYYINEFNDWEVYPVPYFKDGFGENAEYQFSSSDESVVRVMSLGGAPYYEYVSEGECTIRWEFVKDPSIYAEFKVIAYTAKDPDEIKLPDSATAYVGYTTPLKVTFVPLASSHKATIKNGNPDTIKAEYMEGNSVLNITGLKPGHAVASLKTENGLEAVTDLTVLEQEPAWTPHYYIVDLTEGNAYSDPEEETENGYVLRQGHQYYICSEPNFINGITYAGTDNKYLACLKKDMEKAGLFEIASVDSDPNRTEINFKAAKKGSYDVEVVKGHKVKITVQAEGIKMHRLYNPNSGEHFYTAKDKEKDALVSYGWQYEGIGWTAPVTSSTPVYRLYNSHSGDHHYTMKKAERDALIGFGWTDEKIGWYSDDAKQVPLYREYNPNMDKCNHNYTTKKAEHDYLVTHGWNNEGIGWYGIK